MLTEKIDAEAQRLWHRIQRGMITQDQLHKATLLLDRPAIALQGVAPVSSCTRDEICARIKDWGKTYSLHALAFVAVGLADLIESNRSCSLDLVRAIDMVEIWQHHPNARNRNNVAYAYNRALQAIGAASRGMERSGYNDPFARPFGLAVLVLEQAMISITREHEHRNLVWALNRGIEAREVKWMFLLPRAKARARRRVVVDLRKELCDWLLRRNYDYRFIVSGSSP